MLRVLRISVFCLAIVLSQTLAAERQPARQALPRAVVYYSTEDPHWPKAEKVIDAVVKANPGLKLTRVSFDNVQGYWQLLDVERRLDIEPAGELTLVIGNIALTSKGSRRDVETYFGGVVRALRDPDKGRGRIRVDHSAFVRKTFGAEATATFEGKPDGDDRLAPVIVGGKRVGWVIDAFRHIKCPTCIDMQCLIAVDLPKMRVLKVQPQRAIERYGVPVDAEDTGMFVDQFEEWTPATPAVRVDAVVGATKTCRTYVAVVRDVLKQIKRHEKEGREP